MTETAVLVTSPSEHDVLHKASGSLLPGVLVKLLDAENHEITGYDISGEVLVQTPSAALGYLNNETATSETFVNDQHGRWVRTGDEALMTLAPSGNEQLVIVDRIKELIKVKVWFRHHIFQDTILICDFPGSSGRSCRIGSAHPVAPQRRRLCSHSNT